MENKDKVFVCDICGTINSSIPENFKSNEIFFTKTDVKVNQDDIQEGRLTIDPPLDQEEVEAIRTLMSRGWKLKVVE
jgi:hypothetical protein